MSGKHMKKKWKSYAWDEYSVGDVCISHKSVFISINRIITCELVQLNISLKVLGKIYGIDFEMFIICLY